MELKKRFRAIYLGVFKTPNTYDVYFLNGVQKGQILAKVHSLASLEDLLKRNE